MPHQQLLIGLQTQGAELEEGIQGEAPDVYSAMSSDPWAEACFPTRQNPDVRCGHSQSAAGAQSGP